MLARLGSSDGRRSTVLHAWSPSAVESCLPLAATHRPLVIEVEPGADVRRAAAWCASRTVGVVCTTERTRAQLLERGASAARCVVIRPGVPPSNGRPGRPAVRERLRLSADDTVVSILPPISRDAGAFIAAWATLLLEKVRRDVRLLMPAGGREGERVRRLVESCRHGWMARFAPADLALSQLLAASDLAIYLPRADAPLDAVAEAMAAGCPVVAASVPLVREILVDRETAWLCAPNNPEAAARRMLRALEEPDRSRRQAEAARARAATLFDRERMFAQYGAVYANLAQRYPVGRGL